MYKVLALLSYFSGLVFAASSGYLGNSSRLCRPGAQFSRSQLQSSNPSIGVLGDSVSIGWTPDVMANLASVASVQHIPFSQDGGALDTKYQIQCMEYFMKSAQL